MQHNGEAFGALLASSPQPRFFSYSVPLLLPKKHKSISKHTAQWMLDKAVHLGPHKR